MKANRYTQILEKVFFASYKPGDTVVEFERAELEKAAAVLGISLPKNIGDLLYTFRFRSEMPPSIRSAVPKGKTWVIKLAGKARYKFVAEKQSSFLPSKDLIRIKIPDATPGIISRYALDDEQALLALVRYNRLIDIFTGVTTFSLQNHLRSTARGLGQVEVDELYVGVDRRGAHYVCPVQAKGGRDKLSPVQIEQDLALCAEKFPKLICRPIGAQFLPDGAIALMEFAATDSGLRITSERHYHLVPKDSLTEADLDSYRTLSDANQ